MAGAPMKDVPDDAPPALAELALKLRALCRNGTLRDVESRSGVSKATVSRAMGGRELPSLPVTRRIVEACEGDWETFHALWCAAEQERTTGKRWVGARIAELEEKVVRLEKAVRDMQAHTCQCST